MKSQPSKTLIFSASELASGRKISPKFAGLIERTKSDPATRAQLQRAALIRRVEQAGTEVPYYKNLFRKINFSLERLKQDFEYFQDIPYLTKETILNSPELFIKEGLDRKNLIERKTAGSTGVCLSMYYDQESLDWTAAINLYAHSLAGRTLRDKEIHLSNDLRIETGAPTMRSAWEDRIKCLALNRTNVQTKALDRDALAKLYQQLKKERAFLVQGNPSTLYALALFIRDEGIKPEPLFRSFESTGESLDAEKVSLIETQVGAKVFNRYGSAEFGVMAHSRDRFDLLEVFQDSVYVENFIYGSGIPEIVVTGLLNPVMPLIRYRTGDIGEVMIQNSLPMLTQVVGRVHDVIEFGSQRYPTHFFKDLFKKTGGVDEFQFIRKKSGNLELNIVAKNNAGKPEIESLLKPIFQEQVDIRFVRMSELRHVGWRDKFKYLIVE